MRFDVFAHLGNRPLCSHAEHLGQRERGDRLDQRRQPHGERQLGQEVPILSADDVVHQVFGAGGQDESGQAVDDHQTQAKSQSLAMSPDERPGFL